MVAWVVIAIGGGIALLSLLAIVAAIAPALSG